MKTKKTKLFYQNLIARQQVVSGGRVNDLNYHPTETQTANHLGFNQRSRLSQSSDDLSYNNNRWRERSKPSQHQDQNRFLTMKVRNEKSFFVLRRTKRSSERIRAPSLPPQQPHQDPKYEEKIWQQRSENNRQLSYPRECQNFNFGSLDDFGKERGDNFIRFTTVKIIFLFLLLLSISDVTHRNYTYETIPFINMKCIGIRKQIS